MSLLRTLVAATLLVVPLTGCSDEPEEDGGEPADGLVLTRADGTTAELGAPVAGCRAPDDAPGEQVLYVVAGDIARAEGTAFYFSVPEDELDLPLEVSLPWTEADEEHTVFASDGTDEASSAQADATGTVTLTEASCDLGSPVALELDVHLGSELADGQPLDVAGAVSVEAVDLDAYFEQQLEEASGSPTPTG